MFHRTFGNGAVEVMGKAEKKRVLITGAEGLVGSVLRHRLADRYNLVFLTRTPQVFPSHIADVADLDALLSAFAGVDAVIHLAAAAALDVSWEDVLPSNIVGTRNVYEAARLSGVHTVVFASSGHVLGMAEEEAGPALYALDNQRVFDHTTVVRPDSLYAVSKVFGETLGRYYAEVHGMRVICVRLGTVLPDDDPGSYIAGKGSSAPLGEKERHERVRAKWLSHRDCAELFIRCIEAEEVRWAVVFGISDNPRQFWDLSQARRLLGYEPKDQAPVEQQ